MIRITKILQRIIPPHQQQGVLKKKKLPASTTTKFLCRQYYNINHGKRVGKHNIKSSTQRGHKYVKKLQINS